VTLASDLSQTPEHASESSNDEEITSVDPDSKAASRTHRPLGLAGRLVVAVFVAISLSAVVGDIRVASVSFTAFVAAIAGGASWTLLLLYGRTPRAAARAAIPFVMFIASMLISAALERTTLQGVQFLMVQFAFLGAMLLASTARRFVGDHLETVAGRCFRFTAIVLGVATTLAAVGVGGAIGGTRPSAIVALVGMGWFLAEYRAGHSRSLWWSFAILIEIAISLSRTALLAGFVLIAITLLFGSRKNRTRNTILCLLLAFTGAWAVTSWAPLHDRFVQGDTSLSVGGFNINAEGRTEVWAKLWSEIPQDLAVGHGPGAASRRTTEIAPLLDHPHNDYLRILYDFGVLGFALLAWFVFRCFKLLRRATRRPGGSVPALAALYAGLAIMIMMATDNPLDYSFVMIPLGALIGLGLGSARSRRRHSSNRGRTARRREPLVSATSDR
jgi:O-antigen ligase